MKKGIKYFREKKFLVSGFDMYGEEPKIFCTYFKLKNKWDLQ